MNDWHVFSSPDLVHRIKKHVLRPADTFMGQISDCWLFLAIYIYILTAAGLQAANPIVVTGGLTDPFAVVYNDRLYVYATHDFAPDTKWFVMKRWWVWTSDDLVHWRQAGTLHPEDTYLNRPFDECWGSSAAARHGKYYWYFSAGPTEIGVVESGKPAGPWHDPLGRPMIPKGLVPTEARDPTVLMDNDGNSYIVFGTFNYFLARLSDDMISLAEKPKLIELDRKFGPYGAGKTDDKPSLYERNGIYYLSWSSFYAMATNVYGPYAYQGSVIATNGLAPEFRKGNIFHDRHGNFFAWHHQWYYACNDKSQPGRGEFFRDSVISYVHYRDNGEMAAIRLDRIGVGEYDARQARIEAEDYFDANGVEQRECPAGGFEVRGLRDGSYLVYPNVKNLQPEMRMRLRLASANVGGAKLEIREQSPAGKLLGTFTIPDTGDWNRYQTVECALRFKRAKADLCLVPRGGINELLRLDWFSLH